MPVDNGIYDRHAATWWNENGALHGLRTSMNPARLGYIHRVLSDGGRRSMRGLRVLDVGCGGGFLAEPLARMGCHVTGVDPSRATIETARAHAIAGGLHITYVHGRGEALPVESDYFDAVICCDVLEHVDDVRAVVGEMSRALAGGGTLIYDTINRTWQSRLVVIRLMQEWAWSRFVPRDLHDWSRFVTPAELDEELSDAGLESEAVVGLAPGVGPLAMLRAIRDHKAGRITVAELGRRTALREVRDVAVGYMGHARKPSRAPLTLGASILGAA
jgi:2-polyprenyl-6-hydroxyphenyl methylase/3-demethylubiquinone-9 3-methyltransferase